MRDKAFTAISNAAAAAGATVVSYDGRSTTVVAYKGATITIAGRFGGVDTGWAIDVDGTDEGLKKAPSAALKHAVKVVEARRLAEAAAGKVEDSPGAVLVTDIAWLQDAIDGVFHHRDVDHMSNADDLREMCDIADEVEDSDIVECLAVAVRDENGPMLVLTQDNRCVEIEVEVGCSERPEDLADALRLAEAMLSDCAGHLVTLERVPEGADPQFESWETLKCYRAPQREYLEDDIEAVELFGVEIGLYRVIPDGADILTRVTRCLSAYPDAQVSIEDGSCTVFLKVAPGTAEDWSVRICASDRSLVADFEHERYVPEWAHRRMSKREYSAFLRAPDGWAALMWEKVKSREFRRNSLGVLEAV